MRSIFIISLLFVFSLGNAQGILKHNGGTVKAQAPPTYAHPATPEDTTYVDADSVEIILVQNFDWATPQENPTTAYCETGMTNGGEIGSVHWDSTNTKYIAFETLTTGDIILRSDAPQDQCCIESNDPNDDGSANKGTGIIWREYLKADKSDVDTAFLSFNVYVPTVMTITDGVKFNGLYSKSELGHDSRYSAMMVQDGFPYLYYDWGYANATDHANATNYGTPGDDVPNRPNSLPTGRWVNITVLKSIGSTNGYDGLQVCWVDGVKANHNIGMMFNNSVNTVWGFDKLNIETHYGGSTVSYNSDRDNEWWFDDFVVWKYVDGYSYDMLSIPTFGDEILLPEETNFGKKTTSPE